MLGMLKDVRAKLLKLVAQVSWLGPLLGRFTVGVVFIASGWGKLHTLDKVTEFFTSLHLPAPHFQAILVACTELFGGIAVLVGLLTRLAALPLAVTMVVAILTAKRDDIQGLVSLVGFDEWAYLIILLWLALTGPGKASIDYFVGRQLDRDAA